MQAGWRDSCSKSASHDPLKTFSAQKQAREAHSQTVLQRMPTCNDAYFQVRHADLPCSHLAFCKLTAAFLNLAPGETCVYVESKNICPAVQSARTCRRWWEFWGDGIPTNALSQNSISGPTQIHKCVVHNGPLAHLRGYLLISWVNKHK